VNEVRTDIKGGYAYIEVDKMIWLVCNNCGYAKEILETEIMDYDECPLCKEGKMIQDLNKGKSTEEDTPGDNFPIIHKDAKKKSPTDTERLMINALAKEIEEFGEEFVFNNLNIIPIDKRIDYLELFFSAKKLLEKGEY
jgi:hypothetical protein